MAVAFGSQALHHQAMRSLVGDRDLQTVRAASNSLERELSHLTSTIQILSRDLVDKNDFSSLILNPEEISSIFDGGMALFSTDGYLIRSSATFLDWKVLPSQIPVFLQAVKENNSQPLFSSLVVSPGASGSNILIGTYTSQQELLVGAFTPSHLIEKVLGNLIDSGQITVLVVSPAKEKGNYDILFRGGPIKMDENLPEHPGIREVLNGESGINYYQSTAGEHVVAFSPIPMTGWGLIIEEAWEDIASPYLITTQSAPLVIVPVFLLAVLAIWFGARRIVTPLQKLEKQAARLAAGDFEAIRQSVGGIEEIRNLQSELIEMTDKLKA
ncbi:MAG: cache and HAMP domain-containing protein, partial [Anaerolineaceae bacterium]